MRLKVVNHLVPVDTQDGIKHFRECTKVLNAETGEMLEGVQRIVFEANVNEPPTLLIEVIMPDAEIELEGPKVVVRNK